MPNIIITAQNGTDAAPAPEVLAELAVLLMTERPDERVIRRALRHAQPHAHFEHYFPTRDDNQSIHVRTGINVALAEPTDEAFGYTRFHKSAAAEHWHDLHTPTRGAVHADIIVGGAIPLRCIGTQFDTDWTLKGHAHETEIVHEHDLPKINDLIVEALDLHMDVVTMGDFNVHGAKLELPHMDAIATHGNDRAFLSKHARLQFVSWHGGPKVGVGPTWEHEPIVATFQYGGRR